MTDLTEDPRYGQKGWTLIYPANGGRPYFVKVMPRKQRASPRALRFANLRVGDMLLRKVKWTEIHGFKPEPKAALLHQSTANDNRIEEIREATGFAICEHRWFDPVKGEVDPVAGQLVAVRWITNHGLSRSLVPHTIRGLASQGYHQLADDQARLVLEWLAQRDDLVRRHDAGELTQAEVRAAYRGWPMLLRDLGLEEVR